VFSRSDTSRYFDSIALAREATQTCLSAPFEAMRAHYASAVQAGVVPRSLRASAEFGRSLDNLEKLCLGLLARRR
jgi:hypothetical protein